MSSKEARDNGHDDRDQLINFYSVEANLERVSQRNLGVQTIPIDKIVGSLDRYEDFSKGFGLNEEWANDKLRSVREAMEAGRILPPIRVYQLLDNYFVIDGHHRVAVAKNVMGARDIDAEVTLINFDLSLNAQKSYRRLTARAYEFLIRLEEHVFQKKTGLRNNILRRPLKVTELTSYAKLYQEILDFQQKSRPGERRKWSLTEAAYEWVAGRFLPAVDILVKEKILERFPDRTYTDLYVWIQLHKYYLSLKSGRDVGFELTKKDFVKRFGRKPKFLDILPEKFQEITGFLKTLL